MPTKAITAWADTFTDGDFYTGKTVCVAGGGNSALQEAILLSGKCAKVIMLQDLPEFTGEKKLQEILFARENVEKHTGVKITALNTEGGELRSVTVEPQAFVATRRKRLFAMACLWPLG